MNVLGHSPYFVGMPCARCRAASASRCACGRFLCDTCIGQSGSWCVATDCRHFLCDRCSTRRNLSVCRTCNVMIVWICQRHPPEVVTRVREALVKLAERPQLQQGLSLVHGRCCPRPPLACGEPPARRVCVWRFP